MLANWCAAGFDPGAFWGMTPRLYRAALRGVADRRDVDQRSLRWAVWHVAALGRAEKFPAFDGFVGAGREEPKAKSMQALLMWAHRTHEFYKGRA